VKEMKGNEKNLKKDAVNVVKEMKENQADVYK